MVDTFFRLIHLFAIWENDYIVSLEMVAILDFRAATKLHYNFKTTGSNAVKSCTHIEDIHIIHEETCTSIFLVLLNNTF